MMIFFIRIIALNLLFISLFSKHVAQLCVVANDALETTKVGHMTASINRIQNLWTTNLIKAVPNKPCMQYISFLKNLFMEYNGIVIATLGLDRHGKTLKVYTI